MEQLSSHKAKWSLLKRAYYVQFCFYACYLPITLFLTWMLTPVMSAKSATMLAAFSYMAGGFLFFTRAVLSAKSFVCPRCGEKFFGKGHWHNDFARKCMHCGLKKYASE